MATKKVKSAGRFKSRYGVGIRKRVVKVESQQRQRFDCPACGFKKLKRQGTGIYGCAKCGLKMAGGAYLPTTMSGSIVKKMVAQKSFMPLASELIAASEKKPEEALSETKAVKKSEAVKAGKEEKKAKKAAKETKAEAKEVKAEKAVEEAKTVKKEVKKEVKDVKAGKEEAIGSAEE
jgi:large subunit ribosomal protein L37Ae